MTPDSPKEFDFDFQVGSSPAEPSRPVADDGPSNGGGRDEGAATPDAPDDLDAPAHAGNGDAPPSSSPRRRRFLADPGDGDGNGRTRARNGRGTRSGRAARNGRDGTGGSGRGNGAKARPKPRAAAPRERPKLIRRDERDQPQAPPPADPDRSGDEDWLRMTQDDLGGAGLETLPAEDPNGDDPRRVPREGRKLARNARRQAARRRADGRSRLDDRGDVPFESVLERQPQRSKAMRTASPLLDAVRDAANAGGERLREGASRLRYGAANLREGGEERLRALRADPDVQAEPGNGRPPRVPKIAARRPRRPKPGRIKRLRFAVVFLGLGFLALVSTFFGMMMAIARDLPNLETEKQFAVAEKSVVLDNHGRKIGDLLNNNQQILVDSEEISPYMKNAVVAIEDERFYEHTGVDIQAMVRAGTQDLLPGGGLQGGSTITQQFVKNALEAQNSRTIFQKFRESAIAYHLERQWDKDKILTAYLNTIYFGEGAYGIEAAAKTYFGYNHPECLGGDSVDTCSSELTAAEAALLAGIISSPSSYSPKAFPEAAQDRRDLVLEKMKEQGVLSEEEYEEAVNTAIPAPSQIEKPTEDSEAPYFTSWLRQLVVDKYGAGRAFGGGLQIRTTIDLDMQQAVEDAVYNHIAGIGPSAAVVVLDNETGEIRAMYGGEDYEKSQFNVATQGQRQPGSTMKPFILATALSNGYTGSEVFSSQPKDFPIPGVNPKKEMFHVENYEGNYLGSASIATATTYSDNSVYAELGLRLGTKKIANTAMDMGISTPVSDNPAMTLGAVDVGFTPLEMAHAFLTLTADGERVSGNLDTIEGDDPKDPRDDGPVPINRIEGPDGEEIAVNKTSTTRVLDDNVAQNAKGILESVIYTGTGTHAAGPPDAWGKTGTTENFGDAWFCGASTTFTTCVWVGYPNEIIPMETEYGGQPVAGGTYPAEIWASVMIAMESIAASYGTDGDGGTYSGSTSSGYSGTSSSSSSSSSSGSSSGGDSGSAAPAPAPAPAPSGGGGAPSGGGVGL